MRRTVAIVGIAVLLAFRGVASRANGDERERPVGSPPAAWIVRDVADPFEGTALLGAKPTALAVRVIDQAGRGIPGAKIYEVGEATHPLPRLVNGKDDIVYGPTDEWGRLRIEVDASTVSWRHMLVLADGYASSNKWDGQDEIVCQLTLGEDLPVTILDPLDRPVANALVGYRLYCGHTPDVRQETTDAKGRAVLPRIDRRKSKWLWPVGESIASEDFEAGEGGDFSRLGLVLRPGWGSVAQGRVVDAKGAPLAGAAVGGRTWHRGPWTFTDAKGFFRLVGLEPFDRLQFDPDDDTFGTPTSTEAVAVPGVELRVRMPAKDGAPAAPDEQTFAVRVRSADPARPIAEGEDLIAWRPADGRVVGKFERGEDGTPEFALGAGTWVVRLTGPPSSGASVEAVINVTGPTEASVSRVATRSVLVDASALEEGDQVWLGVIGRSVVVTEAARKGSIEVPASGDALLRVLRPPRVRSIRVPVMWSSDAPLRLLPPAPTMISARLRRPDGAEIQAGVELGRLPTYLGDEDEKLDVDVLPLATDWTGLQWFIARPKDEKLAGIAVEVDLGSGELPTIDLGELRFPERSTLVVSIERPAGVAAEDTLVFGEVPNVVWGWYTGAAAETPICLPFAPPSGSVLVGRAKNCLPVRVPVDTPGPYRVAWPRGALEVVVPTSDGAVLDHVQVLVDGERFEPGPTRRVVWVGGISAGEHRVVVSAPGRKAREYKAIWADGETRWLSADLTPR